MTIMAIQNISNTARLPENLRLTMLATQRTTKNN